MCTENAMVGPLSLCHHSTLLTYINSSIIIMYSNSLFYCFWLQVHYTRINMRYISINYLHQWICILMSVSVGQFLITDTQLPSNYLPMLPLFPSNIFSAGWGWHRNMTFTGPIFVWCKCCTKFPKTIATIIILLLYYIILIWHLS